jgi:hypothetical protein
METYQIGPHQKINQSLMLPLFSEQLSPLVNITSPWLLAGLSQGPNKGVFPVLVSFLLSPHHETPPSGPDDI